MHAINSSDIVRVVREGRLPRVGVGWLRGLGGGGKESILTVGRAGAKTLKK